VVTGGSDHTGRIWNALTGEVLAELRGLTDDVRQAVFSPDGMAVAT
jgi:WD40 repeat protein